MGGALTARRVSTEDLKPPKGKFAKGRTELPAVTNVHHEFPGGEETGGGRARVRTGESLREDLGAQAPAG